MLHSTDSYSLLARRAGERLKSAGSKCQTMAPSRAEIGISLLPGSPEGCFPETPRLGAPKPHVFLDFSCLCLRALKDIQAGEEVRMNYAATEYEMSDSCRSDCRSPACLEMIRGFKFLIRDQQLTLKPYLAPYLLRRLDGED